MNFPVKIDLKIRCTLETNTRKLFETNKRVTNIGAPNAQIILTKASFWQYEQSLLPKNFRRYLKTIMLSSEILKIGIQKTPYQKTYEMHATLQDFTVDFLRCNRQFDWLEMSIVYDKRDKHLTIYDSYNA